MPPRPLRVRRPGDLVALVPHLTGYPPRESLVALSLRGPRRRLGLTVRADLVDDPAVVQQVLQGMRADGAGTCALLVHTDRPSTDGVHPFAGLVDDVVAALADAGIAPGELLLVRQGRWWSYACALPCCPPEGTPVEPDSPVVEAVAAAHALSGDAVLGSREELVASLAHRSVLGPAVAAARVERAEVELAGRVLADRPAAVRAELARWRAALGAWQERPRPPGPDDAAALAAALRLVLVRDEVASWALDRSDPLLGLLGDLCRATPSPYDAPVCTLHAWLAYARGNGGLARIGLERALASEPDYALAGLLLTALDHLLPPAEVRELLRQVA